MNEKGSELSVQSKAILYGEVGENLFFLKILTECAIATEVGSLD